MGNEADNLDIMERYGCLEGVSLGGLKLDVLDVIDRFAFLCVST